MKVKTIEDPPIEYYPGEKCKLHGKIVMPDHQVDGRGIFCATIFKSIEDYRLKSYRFHLHLFCNEKNKEALSCFIH